MPTDTGFETSNYLTAFDPENPRADRFNYEAFLADISSIAQDVRSVGGPTSVGMPDFAPVPTTWGGGEFTSQPTAIRTVMAGGSPVYTWAPGAQQAAQAGPDDPAVANAQREANMSQAYAAMQSYASQREAMEEEAERAATALEMRGASTAESMRRLGYMESDILAAQGTASEQWSQAAELAGEYVEASRQRTTELMGTLEDINNSISEEREFGKAHAMQAGVTSMLGSMEAEGRAIAEQYGRDSKEYQQFTAQKSTALGTLSSELQASYQQMAETQGQNYLNAVASSGEQMAMYENFQEQMHVETLQAMATSTHMYAMDTAQALLDIEQLRISGMDDIANWIVSTPSFYMDTQAITALMADLSTSYLI